MGKRNKKRGRYHIEFFIEKNRHSKNQPKTLNLTPHHFKINLFSFWGCAGEMGI